MGDSYESVKLRQYVQYINIISSTLLIVSLICIANLCLCAYGFNTMPSSEDNELEKNSISETTRNILLAVIITLGLSTTLLIVSSILLFLFGMKIIHITEVSRILKDMHSTSKPIIQPLLQDYEEPITCDNTRNRPRTVNLYTTDRDQRMSKKEELLPVYDEVNDEPSFRSNRRNMSPLLGASRKESQNIEQLPDYDEVKEFNVASTSRKMFPPPNEDELPEYHEPIYPNAPNITQQSRFYDRLKEGPLVDYDEVKTVDVEINSGSRIMKSANFHQQSSALVHNKLKEDEELLDYDQVKNENENLKADSSNTGVKQINKGYSNKRKQNQSAENITETSSMNNAHSKSLEDLLQSFNIPENDKLGTNLKKFSNDINMKKMNEELYNKEVTQENARQINNGFKTNTKNVLVRTETSCSKNTDINKTMLEKSTSIKKSSNNRVVETTTNNDENDEDRDYDYIKN